MSEELKQFNINIEDIKEDNNLFNNIQEAIDKLRMCTLSERFEVVLNNNLIETKEKLTNYRTILGCRITYDNLDKNISFIVREDNKPTYEELEKELKEADETVEYWQKECDKRSKTLDKIKEEVLTELQNWKPKDMAISMEISYIEEKLEKLLEEIE